MPKWIKGMPSPNPHGAPKRTWTWAEELTKAVEEHDKNGTPIKEIIAKTLVRETNKGNVQAMKLLLDRMDGLPKQSLEHSGEINSSVMVYKPQKNEE